MISYRLMKRKKDASSITLQEHLESIASMGGQARAEKLSTARKQAIGRKGGKVGGKARAAILTDEQRRAIARKAAEARWGKKKKQGGSPPGETASQAGTRGPERTLASVLRQAQLEKPKGDKE